MEALATDIPLPRNKLSLELINQTRSLISETKGKLYVVLESTGSFNPSTFMHLRCFELARDALNSQGFCVIGGYMSPGNDSYEKKVKTICRDFGLVCIHRGGQEIENIISNDDILKDYKNNIKFFDEVVPNGISFTRLRLLSNYPGLGIMLAVVCKTYEGVKALEVYNKDGFLISGEILMSSSPLDPKRIPLRAILTLKIKLRRQNGKLIGLVKICKRAVTSRPCKVQL